MLKPERAREILEELRRKDDDRERIARLATLPRNLCVAALALLDRDANGKAFSAEPILSGSSIYGYGYAVDWTKLHEAHGRAMRVLEAAGAEGRLEVFAQLFPKFPHHVEVAWHLLERLPYQHDYQRKAFRAPGNNEVLRSPRLHFLTRLASVTSQYDGDLAWFAAWVPYMEWYLHGLPTLFAAAIDAGGSEGEEIFNILVASARGEHEIGAMGRHVTRALLSASRPDGWELVERMLLAAQREEGLRQVILETVDEAHPEAFRRLVRLVLDNDLARFPATVRAFDVWLGYGWDAVSVGAVNNTLRQLLAFLDDPQSAERSLADGESDPETLYLALWTVAFHNAPQAIEPASRLLADPSVERRFVAAHLLGQLKLSAAYEALLPVLDDPDLRVATRAFKSIPERSDSLGEGHFERLERLYARLPDKDVELQPLVWPWQGLTISRKSVADALYHSRGERSPEALYPYMAAMDSWFRAALAEDLVKLAGESSEARDTLFKLAGDPSSYVRDKALDALTKLQVGEDEAVRLEKLLTRKSGDLRRGAISILLKQPDRAALGSVGRLVAAKDRLQRLAGLEMLRKLFEGGRAPDTCRELARAYRDAHPTLDPDEETLLGGPLAAGDAPRKEWTLDDGLGLVNSDWRTPPQEPRSTFLGKLLQKPLVTDAAIACLRSLDELVDAHSNTVILNERWEQEHEELLANFTWGLPEPERGNTPEEDAAWLPLREVWEEWYRNRQPSLRDSDGWELLRALPPMFRGSYWHPTGHPRKEKDEKLPWRAKAKRIIYGDFYHSELKHPAIVRSVLLWLLKLHAPREVVDLLLNGVEATIKLVSRNILIATMQGKAGRFDPWQGYDSWHGWLHLARYHRTHFSADWKNAHHIRLWQLIRWITAGEKGDNSLQIMLEEVLLAHRAGGATEGDILHILIGPRPKRDEHYWSHWSSRWEYQDLQRLSGRKLPPDFAEFPIVRELVDRCRKRILEVELERGDMPTAASGVAFALRWSGGLDVLARLLRAMSRESFVRGWTYDSLSRAAVFSHLVRSTFPAEGDTREAFAQAMREAGIPHKRLIELAMYAPQWAWHVEAALGWEGYTEGVWWLHAHTKDTAWSVDAEIRDAWAAQVSERTALSSQDLIDGAVDVAWFWRVYGALGEERWTALYGAAQYAAGGGGHKRAQLFADAMLGRVGREELVKRIREKRNQDAVRALGLLPLPSDPAERERDVLARYETIQEFLRTSRKFGSQRQASEKLAASIAMQNLARTVGYPDPLRLEWAMEARAIGDLAAGPLTATAEGVTLTLQVNDWGEPELTVTKNGKTLKSVPPKVKKAPEIAALIEREREVKRQASRMRRSLEGAMCRGDAFTGAELRGFASHPVLWPMIERLVFVGEGLAGYPVEGGLALRDHSGKLLPVGKSDELRIAHPHDLLTRGEWQLWQHDLFRMERVQPFKQIFRELYVLTAAEREDGTISRRYAGHQVQPRPALALLGSRGWVSHPEEGVRRTFHDLGVSAWLTFLEGFYTPAEVDGLTLEGVRFTKRDDWKPLNLTDIPPRAFSEVMRDLDLVVSVAHRGGVDPEATASTVEMRASLVRETCELLGLGNVRVQSSHALIEGDLSRYSVHLGSGTVHRQPGGALCIVPVHSQHRGRLFLPFADDDPRTAEVISKVLLLARDQEIKDPTILEQILVG